MLRWTTSRALGLVGVAVVATTASTVSQERSGEATAEFTMRLVATGRLGSPVDLTTTRSSGTRRRRSTR